MFRLSSVLRAPFRVLASPTYSPAHYPGLALGRRHASWFLVYATRPTIESRRAVMCLNFVVPGDPSSIGSLSSSGNPVFTVGGHQSAAHRVRDWLLNLRDEHDCSPVALTERYPADNRYGLLADVEVLLPENELIHACAHCGLWETQFGPRFLRCGGCKSRYYCSEECQKDDWKLQYHQGECELLQDGKAYEVECRRKLHNNGWYFDHGFHGEQTLLEDAGPHTYERAVHHSDVNLLAYGRPYPPHDVVPPTTPRPPLTPRDDGYPPGFVPTGDAKEDSGQYKIHYLRTHGFSDALDAIPKKYPCSNAVPANAIPRFPPLPETPGFVPTGDPLLDEVLLRAYLSKHGTEAQRRELEAVVQARWRAVMLRRQIATDRKRQTSDLIQAVTGWRDNADSDDKE